MKVKIGKLKTHLSRYLKELQNSEEPIEVCVRESTVAYLTAADTETEGLAANAMRRTFEHDGLHVSQWGRKTNTPLPPIGGTPVEGNAVVEMRASREW